MITDPSPSTAGNILHSRKSLFYLDIKQDKTAITTNSGGVGIDKENLPNKSHILSSCTSPMRTHEDQIWVSFTDTIEAIFIVDIVGFVFRNLNKFD